MSIEENLRNIVIKACALAYEDKKLLSKELPEINFEIPKQADHGDLSINIAMQLAKAEKKAPNKIAQIILDHLEPCSDLIEKVSIAGPGFINFNIKNTAYFKELRNILLESAQFGCSDIGSGKKILIEFVSANPTGPLNVVSARAAIFGDALSSILNSAGFKADKEFYVNDVGNQTQLFASSLAARYDQLHGEQASLPEQGYHGDYLKEVAAQIKDESGDRYLKDNNERLTFFRENGLKKMISWQKKSLSQYGVFFDNWFLQSSLFEKNLIEKYLEKLSKKNFTYSEEGALFFKSSQFGDEKDRVIRKSDGDYTYFASDIAYHADKFSRGYEKLIDIFGPDHHGYIARTKAAVEAIGYSPENLVVLISQQVNLLEGDKQVKMSKRAGKLITMDELIEKVGKDVARFFFLMRTASTHLDFDLALATSQTSENPVFYLQYAHARISSIFRKVDHVGQKFEENIDFSLLVLPEEKKIAQSLLEYPKAIQTAAKELEPHYVTSYLLELAKFIQVYYSRAKEDSSYKVISEDLERTRSKLYLLKCAQIVLKNGLTLLGITAPEEM